METLVPLRAIVFQCLFLLVAVALEAAVLRQRLTLGYKVSVQYAASINLMTTSLGWVMFLGVESLVPIPLRAQVISYIFFDRFFANDWVDTIGIWLIVAGFFAFFATFAVKFQLLELLLIILERQPQTTQPERLSRRERYQEARGSKRGESNRNRLFHAVLQANGVSFTAILLLLLLRTFAWTL